MSSKSSPSALRVFAATDAGGRGHNEDSYVVVHLRLNDVNVLIAAVADGVGGLSAGDVASRMGLAAFVSRLVEKLFSGAALKLDDGLVVEAIRAAVDYANEVILDNVPRSGTTLVAAVIVGDIAYIVNVGDSRAYIITDDEIHQVTRDHSLAWQDLQKEISKLINTKVDFKELAEFRRRFIQTHPRTHVINNVVGFFGKVEPIDVFKITLYEGDSLLLCSDGLSDVLNDYDIYKIVTSDREAAVDNLIREAKKDATDNITVVHILKQRSR